MSNRFPKKSIGVKINRLISLGDGNVDWNGFELLNPKIQMFKNNTRSVHKFTAIVHLVILNYSHLGKL